MTKNIAGRGFTMETAVQEILCQANRFMVTGTVGRAG